MNRTHSKKAEGKFTIQFSRTDSAHLQATNILNSKERRGKAQYIVNAILYYESQFGALNIKPTAPFDEKSIGAVVNRILLNKRSGNTGILPEAVPSGQVYRQAQSDQDIVIDDDIEALGTGGISAVTGAMEMFRKKQ